MLGPAGARAWVYCHERPTPADTEARPLSVAYRALIRGASATLGTLRARPGASTRNPVSTARRRAATQRRSAQNAGTTNVLYRKRVSGRTATGYGRGYCPLKP